MIYIAGKHLIHGDIKPGNILISQREGRLRAFVGDFGLTGKSGGTSMFMAPEGLDKDSRIVEKTDLYSFAVTVLFLIFPYDLAMQLLFLPISQDLEYFRQTLHRFKLLEIVFKSLRWNGEKRVTVQSWSVVADLIKGLEVLMLVGKNEKDKKEEEKIWNKIWKTNLESKGVVLDPLKKALLNESGFIMNLIDVNQNEAWVMTNTHVSHVQKLSSIYFDKKFSLLSKSMIFMTYWPLDYGDGTLLDPFFYRYKKWN